MIYVLTNCFSFFILVRNSVHLVKHSMLYFASRIALSLTPHSFGTFRCILFIYKKESNTGQKKNGYNTTIEKQKNNVVQ